MTDITPTKEYSSRRLSVWITGAAITAGVALWLREGQRSIELPICMALLLLSYVFSNRLSKNYAKNICRAAAFIIVAALYKIHPPNNVSAVIDSPVLDIIGEICVAEIVVRAWSVRISKFSDSAPILLSAVTFVMATNTYNDMIGRWFTPFFIICLLGAQQSLRAEAFEEAKRRARAGAIIISIVTCLIGGTTYQLLFANRDAVTDWANKLFQEAHISFPNASLSEENHLASLFGQEGSLDRVLQIKGDLLNPYMRAMAMDRYSSGSWGPTGRERAANYHPIEDSFLQTNGPGSLVQVRRYTTMRGMVVAPLSFTWMDNPGAGNLRWDKEDGGPLRCNEPPPDTYSIRVADMDYQGPFCTAPSATGLKRLLDVPPQISPAVRQLAKSITQGITDPLKKAEAIQLYLPSHHKYSLRIHVDPHEPLSDFLLSDKGAHCEFFAAGAAMLMRCAGVPARYVIGYYAHEIEDNGLMVRQRDAHAWAECYIEGKGWITIDATPSDGKPQGTPKTIPYWKRWVERWQDRIAAFKQKLTIENVAKAVIVLAIFTGLCLLLQYRYHFKWRRTAKVRTTDYTATTKELASIHTRFVTICKNAGLECPANMPWQEYLSSQPEATSINQPVTQSALAFISTYNAARFGVPTQVDSLNTLNKHLEQIQIEITAIGKSKPPITGAS